MTNDLKVKDRKTVEQIQLGELTEKKTQGKSLFDSNFDIIKDVRVKLEACIGEAEISVNELYNLKSNSIVKLNKDSQAPIDLVLDGRVVARGHLVVTGDNFGISISEIMKQNAD
jgi:flagellar motor switch protein FliN/FliY